MAGINRKIMAFIGTEETAELVSALAEYTDNIYAAVSDEYGKASHPSGNITLLSRYLDEEKMNSWIDRVGVDLVIDGTDLTAEAPRKLIAKVCESRNIEYIRIAKKMQTNLSTTIFRSQEQLVREMEYTVGNVLAEGDLTLMKMLTGVKDYQDKVFPMVSAEEGVFEALTDMGYRKENIISFNRMIHAGLLMALFQEFSISDYIYQGSLQIGLRERLEAVDHSAVKAAVYGDLAQEEGIEASAAWDMLSSRFGIGD